MKLLKVRNFEYQARSSVQPDHIPLRLFSLFQATAWPKLSHMSMHQGVQLAQGRCPCFRHTDTPPDLARTSADLAAEWGRRRVRAHLVSVRSDKNRGSARHVRSADRRTPRLQIARPAAPAHRRRRHRRGRCRPGTRRQILRRPTTVQLRSVTGGGGASLKRCKDGQRG